MKYPYSYKLNSVIERQTSLIQSYSKIKGLSFIIKACRLRPSGYVIDRDKKELQKLWFDEYYNSLKITKCKRIKIVYGDLSLDKKKIICTDLYNGLSLDKIAKISKFVHICYGQDEDFYQDCLVISFLGIDNQIRTYLHIYGEWQQVSPLMIGFKNLQMIFNNIDIKYYREFSVKKTILPCHKAKLWLSCLPMNKDFISILNKQCGIVYSIFDK